MNRWRAEYDDGIWRFYRDGMELGLYEKGDVVVDALNVAESRIAELEEIDRMRSESVSTLNQANANNEDEIELLEKRIAELEALLDELKPYRAYDYP